MNQAIIKTIDLGDGRTITIETGRLAKQADGAVVVKMGDTMLIGNRCGCTLKPKKMWILCHFRLITVKNSPPPDVSRRIPETRITSF
jgi:hypothetical protein